MKGGGGGVGSVDTLCIWVMSLSLIQSQIYNLNILFFFSPQLRDERL